MNKITLTLLASLILFTSCDYKDLVEAPDVNTVHISFDWSAVDSMPSSMRVAFYPVEGRAVELIQKGYSYSDFRPVGGDIVLPLGKYNLTAWNNDITYASVIGVHEQKNILATTSDYVSRAFFDSPLILDSIFAGQKQVDWPDYMVHASHQFVVKSCCHDTLVIRPDSMVVTVEIRVHGLRGLEGVKEARGILGNVSVSRLVTPDNQGVHCGAVVFECENYPADSLVTTTFTVFGTEPELRHDLVLFFWLDDAKVYLPIDVTALMNAYTVDDKRIILDIDASGANLREFSGDGKFNVTVDDWDVMYIDLNI